MQMLNLLALLSQNLFFKKKISEFQSSFILYTFLMD